MYSLNKMCQRLDVEYEIFPLATELVKAGCRPESALWIAIKYAGVGTYHPTAELMARACEMTIDDLVILERQDLHSIGWNVMKYAKPISADFLIRQLQQTASVNEYTESFHELIRDLPNFSESEKCEVYFSGLSDTIQTRLKKTISCSFDQLVARALSCDV